MSLERPTQPASSGHHDTQVATSRQRFRSRLMTGLGLLSAASIGTVVLIPGLAGGLAGPAGANQPSFGLIASIGVTLILLTSLFLAYTSRVLGLGRAWLVWALAYNGCIVATKFIVSPVSLYGTTFVDSAPFNARSLVTVPVVALALLCIYAGVFGMIQINQHARVKSELRVLAARDGVPGPKRTPWDRTTRWLIVGGVALAILATLNAGWALLVGLPYISAIIGTTAIPLLLLLGVALTGGIKAFEKAGDRSIQMRDIAILSSFAWVGLSLLLMYHVVWVIFTAILVSIWPLKVVPSSGK
jgi:hypothetical protein